MLIETKPDGVLSITLDDEPNRNTLTPELATTLLDRMEMADSDPEIRVVVLTNTGSVFCAGADLNRARAGHNSRDVFALYRRLLEHPRLSPKPYVGRIAGHVRAGGMGLVASLDISIAREDVTFAFPEVRIGVAPAMAAMACLAKMRLEGVREHLLRGDQFDAVRAVEVGLISTAVPSERLDSETDRVLLDLVSGGPGALRATKDLIRVITALDERDAWPWVQDLSQQMFDGEEAQEGIAAFLEKRPPRWRGCTGRPFS